jgi:hypothetical protein
MNYKLTEVANGETQFIRKAGSAYVKATMPIGKAEGIIGTGKVKESDKFDGFPIAVNGEYFFPGELVEEKSSDNEDKTYDEPKDYGWKKHDKR